MRVALNANRHDGTKDRRRKQRKNSLDNTCVRSRNSVHVVFNNLAMVVLDLLSTVPVEIKFVQSFVRAVAIVGTLIESDLGRRRRGSFLAALVLVVFTSCFEDFEFTREGVDVVASHDPTGGQDSVSSAKEQVTYYVLVRIWHWRCGDSGERKSSEGEQ